MYVCESDIAAAVMSVTSHQRRDVLLDNSEQVVAQESLHMRSLVLPEGPTFMPTVAVSVSVVYVLADHESQGSAGGLLQPFDAPAGFEGSRVLPLAHTGEHLDE